MDRRTCGIFLLCVIYNVFTPHYIPYVCLGKPKFRVLQIQMRARHVLHERAMKEWREFRAERLVCFSLVHTSHATGKGFGHLIGSDHITLYYQEWDRTRGRERSPEVSRLFSALQFWYL